MLQVELLMGKDQRSDGESELLRIMVYDLSESQPLPGVDRCCQRQHPKPLYPITVKINGALALQGIVAEHVTGHVFKIGTQHDVKKTFRPPRNILLISLYELRYVEPSIPAAP